MKRLPLIALAAIGLAAIVFALARALESDEERIRERLADLVTDFNDRSALSFGGGFTADYVDDTSGADRSMLQRVVLLLGQRRSKYEADLLLDTLSIEVADGAESASAVFEARLLEDDRSVWHVKIHAELRSEDGAWPIAGSRHETLAGSRPLR